MGSMANVWEIITQSTQLALPFLVAMSRAGGVGW